MNLRKALGKTRTGREVELNITPIMNIFVILIPFLLLTATFVRIAIIELSLPTLDQSGGGEASEKELTVLVVAISPEGFEVKTSEKKFPLIPKVGERFDYRELKEKLREVKQQFPKLEDVIISPTSEIRYETIIKVMDQCREVGFPNFSITG